MKDLKLFDTNVTIGRWGGFRQESFYTAERLLEEMDSCGIDEALVAHSLAKASAPSLGNEILVKEIESNKRLHPLWTLLPHHTGEVEHPLRVVRDMIAKGVRAGKIYPKGHGYPIAETVVGDLLLALDKYRVPLFVEFDDVTWSDIEWMLKAYPNMPLILQRIGYRADRVLYPFLERYSNLYIEISWYQPHRGIEMITRRFGAERLLFGTAMPLISPGAAVMMVVHADISDSEKALVAGDNLRRLLQEVGTDVLS